MKEILDIAIGEAGVAGLIFTELIQPQRSLPAKVQSEVEKLGINTK